MGRRAYLPTLQGLCALALKHSIGMECVRGMLTFPNPSRSYDERRQCMRFWAHDEALEIPFFLEASALLFLSPLTCCDETELLRTFDQNRAAIQTAAARVYVRHRSPFYALTAADFG
jgi:hypothetical protein